MNLLILDADETSGDLVAVARTDDDLVVERIPDSDIAALKSFSDQLRNAAAGQDTPPKQDKLREFSEQLFNTLIKGQVRDVYAHQSDATFSLEILSNRAALQAVPWEYMVEKNAALGPDRERHLVRLVEARGAKLKPKKLSSRIRILFAYADPRDQQPVAWKTVRDQIAQQFASRLDKDSYELTLVEGASYKALQDALDKGSVDVFHFQGHGLLKADASGKEAAFLALRSSEGDTVEESADNIASLLKGRGIRLAMFSTCNSSAGNASRPNAVIAKTLVNAAGIPAVVANQFQVRTSVPPIFASKVYEWLLRTGDIDQAVTEGRLALNNPELSLNEQDAMIEWGIPTLHRRLNGSQLFDRP